MRPRLLDLFCGEGGCSAGYVRAGFDVFGIDTAKQTRYPHEFLQVDALDFLAEVSPGDFDLIHASPPCKSENPLRHLHDVEHPDLLTPTLAMLRAGTTPWIVENVEATDKMPGALVLCGEAFGLGAVCRDGVYRPLKRHRLFESSLPLMSSGCACSGRQPVGIYGHGGGGQMTRGYKATLADARASMGIDWMSRRGISQAIPPAYTEYLGEQAIDLIRVAA